MAFQLRTMWMIDISNRSSITEVHRWNFDAYNTSGTIYTISPINSTTILIAIGNGTSPYIALDLMTISLIDYSVLRTIRVTNNSYIPFNGFSQVVNGKVYWACLFTVCSFDVNTFATPHCMAYPAPYDLGLTLANNRPFVFTNGTQLVISINSAFSVALLDITNMNNLILLDSQATPAYGMKKISPHFYFHLLLFIIIFILK